MSSMSQHRQKFGPPAALDVLRIIDTLREEEKIAKHIKYSKAL